MALTITLPESEAFSKIGGAFDTLSDAYPYVSKFLSTIDTVRETSGGMEKVLKNTKTARQIWSYGRKIQEALDEKTRDGAFLKLGVKLSLDIAGKVLGTSLTTHPYYAYHKAMLDYLADALNANRNAKEAIAAYRNAVNAAMSKAVSDEFKKLDGRKVTISANYSDFSKVVGTAADIARGLLSPPMVRKAVAQHGAGKIAQSLLDLDNWRIAWSGLAYEALQLQIMAGNELNTAKAAMKRMKDMLKTLMGKNALNQVNGYGAINQIEWEKYDQLVNQKAPQQAVMDPVAYAQGNVDKAAAWAQELSAMCDFARTTDAIYPSMYNKQLEKLNKVLYG